MTKIVYNSGFGGFGISEVGVKYIAKLKGVSPDDINQYDIDRMDPALVAAVETLGSAANGPGSTLAITTVPAGTRYRIDEYDGLETVMTIDDYTWTVA